MQMAAVTLRFNTRTKHRNLSGKLFPIAFPSEQRLSAPTQAGAHSLGAVQIFLWSWSIMFLTLRFQQPGCSFLRERLPKRGMQKALEPLPHPLRKEGTASLRPSCRRHPTFGRPRRAQGPALGGGRQGATSPLRHPQDAAGRRPAAPQPPTVPLPPHQHLPSTPLGRPAAFPQPRPAEHVRGASRKAWGRGCPGRGRADGPPGPTGEKQRPSLTLRAPHLPSPADPRRPQPTARTAAPARAHRQEGRGGAEALGPAPRPRPLGGAGRCGAGAGAHAPRPFP